MASEKNLVSRTPLGALLALFAALLPVFVHAQAAASSGVTRIVGTVVSVSDTSVTVKPDSGDNVKLGVTDATRVARIAPGEKDLKKAVPYQLKDLQPGDRVLIAARPGGDGAALNASTVITMNQADVAGKQQQDLQEWQRHGVGGIVKSIDPAAHSITISAGPSQTVTVNTSGNTGFLRYAPGSVKFGDATKGSFDQIKPGDQLRARGQRSSDGKELAADQVISGTFRSIAGTVSSIDTANNSIVVMDLATKKTVTVKITPETQMRKLPQMIAVRIAMFLKGGAAAGQGGGASAQQASQQQRPAGDGAQGGGGGQFAARPGGGQGGAPGGTPDFQQIIRRMPASTMADLNKGDAVMIVTTEGSAGSELAALTLISGVEPILASPNQGSAANLLSGWSMSSGPEGGDSQ
jgi:preprotein translocase subunit YajC